MIKKHLIACSGMLVLMVMVKLFIFCTPSNNTESTFYVDLPEKQPSPNRPVSSLSFANEEMPLNDPNVIKRLHKALKAYNFRSQQTNMLHKRAKQWFPLVESILKIYGIPEDFKYIPLVESGFKKGTSSYRGASGYWQFMPQTARDYGLRVDNEVDERQDIRKSTIAACKYLRSIYSEFGNWTLAAAAYNLGEIKLQKQINRQGEDNYFKMKLNKETGSYVYNLVSMKEVIENPEKHGYIANPEPFVFPKTYLHPANYAIRSGVDDPKLFRD